MDLIMVKDLLTFKKVYFCDVDITLTIDYFHEPSSLVGK